MRLATVSAASHRGTAAPAAPSSVCLYLTIFQQFFVGFLDVPAGAFILLDMADPGGHEEKQQDFSPVEFFPWEEGLCVQCMHISSYDDEPGTAANMEKYAKAQGYEADFGEGRFRHEIYLSDVRRCKPERLKTVICQPVRRMI